MTINCGNEHFMVKQGTQWDGQNLYALYQKAYTPWEWQPKLMEFATSIGLTLFSTPFDSSAVDFLENMHVAAYKIASFEMTDYSLIRLIASKMKPIIMSTGIATQDEIRDAVDICHKQGNDKLVLLKCTSAYPAAPEDMNVRGMEYLRETYGTLVGLSDHSMHESVSVAAIALGAVVIEKHFILDRSIGGPDASFSLEPSEFRDLVDTIRLTEKALGKKIYELSPKDRKNREFSRSLFAVENIEPGESLTCSNIRSIRPSFGLHPKHYDELLGRQAKSFIARGTPLSWDIVI